MTDKYNELFIGGDLSGIQKFLYNITSKKAMVSLMGRSYFLSQFMQQVADDILQLSEVANGKSERIYCSGGKFYLRVVNTAETVSELEEYIKTTKSKMWHDHQGELSINICYIPFSENNDGTVDVAGMTGRNCGILWRLATEEFARQKNRRFYDEIKVNYNAFFEVKSISAAPHVCAITGVESEDCVPISYNDNSIFVLPSVRDQIETGELLRKKLGFKDIYSYAEDTYLGILRMDVDGLGKRFIAGFPSIAEYKVFSNRLDYFFNTMLYDIQKSAEYRSNLNIVYAGGDDIFVIGRWDKVVDFANEVRIRFSTYVSSEDLSISGGIAIVHANYPIAKAAEIAGEAEDMAKHSNNEAKNAFCIFGEVMSWTKEFEYVESMKNEFCYLINERGMSRGILHRLMGYAQIIKRNQMWARHGEKPDYSYMWHTPYYLKRYMDRYKSSAEIVAFCARLKDKELTGDINKFRLVSIAARWAELLIRNNN